MPIFDYAMPRCFIRRTIPGKERRYSQAQTCPSQANMAAVAFLQNAQINRRPPYAQDARFFFFSIIDAAFRLAFR